MSEPKGTAHCLLPNIDPVQSETCSLVLALNKCNVCAVEAQRAAARGYMRTCLLNAEARGPLVSHVCGKQVQALSNECLHARPFPILSEHPYTVAAELPVRPALPCPALPCPVLPCQTHCKGSPIVKWYLLGCCSVTWQKPNHAVLMGCILVSWPSERESLFWRHCHSASWW